MPNPFDNADIGHPALVGDEGRQGRRPGHLAVLDGWTFVVRSRQELAG